MVVKTTGRQKISLAYLSICKPGLLEPCLCAPSGALGVLNSCLLFSLQMILRRDMNVVARSILVAAVASVLAVVGIALSTQALIRYFSRQTEARPNIILIVTDDQRYDSLDAMPYLQALASQGTTFTHAYVTTPLCCPSRSSILTGQYAHNHGVLTNQPPNGGFENFSDTSTLPVWLHKAGYQTALFGKYLNGYSDDDASYAPPGWDHFTAFVNAPGYYNFTLTRHHNGVHEGTQKYTRAEDTYSTDLLAEEIAQFIDNTTHESDRPFFIMYTPYAPHGPTTPPDRYAEVTSTHENLPSYDEIDVEDKASGTTQRQPLTNEQKASIELTKNKTWGTLRAVDDGLQTILDALEDADVAENTVIIYTTDNGFHWGEHRIPFGKSTPYEEAIHVPLIVYDGRNSQARVDSRLVLNIDIAPTIAELAQARHSGTDGHSWLDQAFTRDAFLVESWGKSAATFTQIHTRTLTLIKFATGEEELYDLSQDPFQMENVLNNSHYLPMRSLLETTLEQLESCQQKDCDISLQDGDEQSL